MKKLWFIALGLLWVAMAFSQAAAAQTNTPITLSFTGTGTGNVNGLSLAGSGTLPPFGAATVAVTGGGGKKALSLSFSFTFSDGDTLTASSTFAVPGSLSISGNANVTGGTGAFASAAGTFSFTITAPFGTTAGNVSFMLTGSGTLGVSGPATCGGALAANQTQISFPISASTPNLEATAALTITGNAAQTFTVTASTSTGGPWLSVSPLSGVLSTACNTIITVEVSAKGLAPNVYKGTVTVTSPAGSTLPADTITIPVTMTLSGVSVPPGCGGALSANQTQISFPINAATLSLSATTALAITGNTAQTFTATAATSEGGSWLSISPASGTISAACSTILTVEVAANGLNPAVYEGSVTVASPAGSTQPADIITVPVTMTISGATHSLVLSETGLQFQGVAGGAAPAAQSIAMSDGGSGGLSFSASASTGSGGNWLSVTPASGMAGSGMPSTVSISLDTAGLAAGTYSGRVDFTAANAANSPQSVEVVLTLTADNGVPSFSTGYLLFFSIENANPAPQTFLVYNSSSQPLTVSATATVTTVIPGWLTVASSGPAATAGQPVTLTVSANAASLPHILPYPAEREVFSSGDIHVQTGDGSSQRIPVTLAVLHNQCVPVSLIPVIKTPILDFQVSAGMPVPVEAQVYDDCGSLVKAGSVVASLFNANRSSPESSVSMTPIGNGKWTGTLTPHQPLQFAVIVCYASETTPQVNGYDSVNGTVVPNTNTPIVSTGGVVSGASGAGGGLGAPGGYITLYGTGLAGQGSGPTQGIGAVADHVQASTKDALAPTTLHGTQVLLGGKALPLTYAGPKQINAIVPFDVPVNTTLQLFVIHDGVYSLPETVVLAEAQPAVFTQDGSGKGAGAIMVVKADGRQFLNTTSTPANAGDALVIYCTGLGAVTPAVPDGSAAPASPPATTVNPVTVTIGGKPAQVLFSGLAPGFAGLYQVNVTVPSGIAAASDVPVILSVAGISSPPVTVAIR